MFAIRLTAPPPADATTTTGGDRQRAREVARSGLVFWGRFRAVSPDVIVVGRVERMRRIVTSVAILGTLAGCAAGEPASGGEGDPSEEFDQSVQDLEMEFGDDTKADVFGVDECDVLRPLLDAADGSIRSGFFLGVKGSAVIGGVAGPSGYDLVFDLYHHQATVSQYKGDGVALKLAGAGVEVYAGVANGFDYGVNDWNGYFVTTSLSLSLPFLEGFLSLDPALFVSAEDRNGDGIIGETEVLTPPDGVYGFGVGVEVSLSIPTGLPVGGSVIEGLWQPHPEAIRWFYDMFRDTRFFRVGGRLSVRLIDDRTGEECHPDWPEARPDQDCVIEFGDPGWSHTRRGLHLGYGVCSATAGCEVPASWPMSAAAIGVGAVRDAGGELAELCPDLVAP